MAWLFGRPLAELFSSTVSSTYSNAREQALCRDVLRKYIYEIMNEKLYVEILLKKIKRNKLITNLNPEIKLEAQLRDIVKMHFCEHFNKSREFVDALKFDAEFNFLAEKIYNAMLLDLGFVL